jgi:hypothetical protein
METRRYRVFKYLIAFGFSPVHKGLKLIIEAVLQIAGAENPPDLKTVYTALANARGVSVSCVQKNIKNAIDFAGLNCNIDAFSEEFGYIIKNDGAVANAPFLYYVAGKLKYAML